MDIKGILSGDDIIGEKCCPNLAVCNDKCKVNNAGYPGNSRYCYADYTGNWGQCNVPYASTDRWGCRTPSKWQTYPGKKNRFISDQNRYEQLMSYNSNKFIIIT